MNDKPPNLDGQIWFKDGEPWMFMNGVWVPVKVEIMFSPWAYECFNMGPPPKPVVHRRRRASNPDEQGFAE